MAPRRRNPTAQGEVILQRMEERSLSVAEVERRTPLTKNTILNAIYGPRLPQRKTIELLAEALDLPIADLTRPGLAANAAARFSTFGSWLARRGNAALWISLLGAVVTALLLWRQLGTSAASPLVTAVHCGVILALLTRLPRATVEPRVYEAASPELRFGLAAAADFRRFWGIAWTFWLFLYLGILLASLSGWLPTAEGVSAGARWSAVGLNFLQNGTTVFLLLGYEVLARPTVTADLSRTQLLPTEAWLAFALVASLLEVGVVLFGVSWGVQQWFGWGSGFAQGTALALLVGRLESRYVAPPTIVIAALYLYAAIQGAWPVFQTHETLMIWLTFAALVLKCLLFLFIAWLFESRIVLFYLTRIRELDDDLEPGRIEFLRRIQSEPGPRVAKR